MSPLRVRVNKNPGVRPSEPGKPRYSTALFAYFDYEALVTPLAEIQGEDLTKRATKDWVLVKGVIGFRV